MNTFIILLFIAFSCYIYFINNIIVIFTLLLLTLLGIYLKKISLKSFKSVSIFIILTIFINLLFSSLIDSFLIGIRLLIIYLLTLIINNYMSSQDIARSISKLFFFSKNKKDLELIIAISLSLIPIMIEEARSIKNILISRNFKFSFKNVLLKPNIFIGTFFSNMFLRINDLESVLITKGYEKD